MDDSSGFLGQSLTAGHLIPLVTGAPPVSGRGICFQTATAFVVLPLGITWKAEDGMATIDWFDGTPVTSLSIRTSVAFLAAICA